MWSGQLSKASQLHCVGVIGEESLIGVEQQGNNLADIVASLIGELVLRRVEDRLENRHQLRSQLLDGGFLRLDCQRQLVLSSLLAC